MKTIYLKNRNLSLLLLAILAMMIVACTPSAVEPAAQIGKMLRQSKTLVKLS